jgi:hypothetical protein
MNSILEAACQVCNATRQQTKHGVSFQQLLTQLRRQFRKNGFDIRIKTMRHKNLDDEEFYVNAYYDPEDDKDREIPIEVVVHHNFDQEEIWDTKHVTALLIQVFDAVVHEFKHQRQSRKRNFKVFWNQYTYLDDPDEIDAYSVSIAIELCRTLGKYRALRYMHRFSSLSRMKVNHNFVSPNLTAYFDSFNNSPQIIKLLAKKVYVRIQKLDMDCVFL